MTVVEQKSRSVSYQPSVGAKMKKKKNSEKKKSSRRPKFVQWS
jgi:hypothetical protein